MKNLYINCLNGAAGDMLSAALLELFPNREEMLSKLNAMNIPGVIYAAEKAQSYSISGTHMKVTYHDEEEGEEHHHHHHHRHVFDINNIIDGISVCDKVKNDIKAVYHIIAAAEAEVHGCEIEHIHFHELGTMDAVADISAVCYMLHELGVEHITASKVCTGYGEVKCAHGILPVPAPATANILKNMPSFAGEAEGERCTPTGAALLKYFVESYGEAPEMTVTAVGYGIGKKDFGRMNAVRISLGESEETAIELCCNVDDMSPEAIGYAIEALFAGGAADVFYTPVGMKKQRPGMLLSVICREKMRDEMVRLIFKHTTTIGIRETMCRRYVLKRRNEIAETPYGTVRIKCSEGFGAEKRKAEYDDLARIARDNDLSIEDVKALIK